MKFAHVFRRLTAVGTAFRYEQHSTVLRAQIGSVPSAIRRRLRSKVDDNVKNRSPSATNEFGLKRRCYLIVQSADRAPPNTQSHVGLYRREIDLVFRELALAPSSHEATTTIVQRRGLDKPGAKNSARMKFHRRVSVDFGDSKRLLSMRLEPKLGKRVICSSQSSLGFRPPWKSRYQSATQRSASSIGKRHCQPRNVAALVTSSLSSCSSGGWWASSCTHVYVSAPMGRQGLDNVTNRARVAFRRTKVPRSRVSLNIFGQRLSERHVSREAIQYVLPRTHRLRMAQHHGSGLHKRRDGVGDKLPWASSLRRR